MLNNNPKIKSKWDGIKKYLRVVNYLAAAQLYLKDNFFLERPLNSEDIKNRLLGHWGGATGVNFFLTHLNFYLKENQNKNSKLRDILFLLGPGHDFPALQANLFMEKTLSEYFSKNKIYKNIYDFEINYDKKGLEKMIKYFGVPDGFPTHASPVTPGAILEGGELGYSVSNASGAVLDNKDLIAVCMIGDGEFETASLATSFHASKFINSKDNGVVLPVINLNGYKISGPTILGRMEDKDLINLFSGLGYEVFILDARSNTNILENKNNYYQDKDEVHIEMQRILDKVFKKILEMKKKGETKGLPIILLKSDKGWTGPKNFHKIKIEGNCESHQVPFPNAKKNQEELENLEKWLKSYKIEELFYKEEDDIKNLVEKRFNLDKKLFIKEVEDIVPEKFYRIGMNIHSSSNGKGKLKELKIPNLDKVFKETILKTDKSWDKHSPMEVVGEYMKDIFHLNKTAKNFRFFSPDETYSNKLDAIFKEEKRGWTLPIMPWDKDLASEGRIIEMLSENTLIGMMMGYILTGRHAMFATYEAFMQVATSMIDQYLKFLRVSKHIPWRNDFSSFNLILTSAGWLQEHNGYSHQNPGFIDDMFNRNSDLVEMYFPMDAVATGYAIQDMIKSKNKINILSAGKDDERLIFLSPNEARKSIQEHMIILKKYSDKINKGENYEILICGVGDYMSLECLAGIDLVNKLFKKFKLEKDRKKIKIGFLNIAKMEGGSIFSYVENKFNKKLKSLVGEKVKVFANFHGHPQILERIFFEAGYNKKDVEVRGYIEKGSITTLLDMHLQNKTSRYHVANFIFENLRELKKIDKNDFDFFKLEVIKQKEIEENFIKENHSDSENVKNWKWVD